MENSLADLLAILPESAQYYLIFCTDQEFKLVGLRRLASQANQQTRLSRLSIFVMDMRTTFGAGAAAAVAPPQPSQPATVPKRHRRKASVDTAAMPKPKPATSSKRSRGVATVQPDPSQPQTPGAAAIATGLHPALRQPIRPQLPALPRNSFVKGHMPPYTGYRHVF